MYGGDRFARQSTPPVREGEELDVTIEAVGEKGDGIARKEGFVLFVPGTQRGEEVRIRVTRVLAKVGFAEKIGAAQKKPAAPQRAPREEKKAEPEFDPQENLDSEDFGDEKAGEDDDDSEEDLEEEQEEK
jgi:predicted RNA-binding protein with TRAM domain